MVLRRSSPSDQHGRALDGLAKTVQVIVISWIRGEIPDFVAPGVSGRSNAALHSETGNST